MPHSTAVAACLAFTLSLNALGAHAAVVASAGDASIVHDQVTGTWTLSSGGTTLKLALDATRDFAITSLMTASGKAWTLGALADTTLKIGEKTLPLGSRAAGFALRDVSVGSESGRRQLNATWELQASGLSVTRHYAIVSGSPAFEAWTTYTPADNAAPLSDLNALQITVQNGAVHSMTGLQGDNADVQSDGAFTLKQQALVAGQHFAIGSRGRSSEQWVPWIAIDGAQDEFYLALMWSGAWSLTADRTSGSWIALNVGLAPMTTVLHGPTDGPHVVFGLVRGGLPQATAALRSYVQDGIRLGRPLMPLVTYNTWFAYGTEVDDASMRSEMANAATLGAELFVVDAGWYVGAGAADRFDFDAGLGSWTPDPVRFPDGLRPLRDYAHALGLEFGIWVEPERVNLSFVGHSGPSGDTVDLDEHWLATSGGGYQASDSAEICLSNTAARRWILGWLTPLLDEVQPDYLKWDSNLSVNCDREGHEHGATDGNFAHVKGLYDILSMLRQKYPDLVIENASGGGNRLDLGMLNYTDVGWMDDRTAPSVHVRHNVEGLSAVFPPAYLLSFVTDHEAEPLHDAPDISLYVRSRMPGALGLCFRSDGLSEGDANSISREIAIYKAMRTTLSLAAGSLLSAQASETHGPAWDVIQETAAGNDELLVCAFQSDSGVAKINVQPKGLDPEKTYRVTSVDTGVLGTAAGKDLMSSGIDVIQSPNTAAHILLIKAQ